jgi:hypothetical protein
MPRSMKPCGGGAGNIAHAPMRGMGWGSREPPKPANEAEGIKPQLNAGNSTTRAEQLT